MCKVQVLFTGGGTGGHVFPGLSLVSHLLNILHTKYPQHAYDMESFAWVGSHKGPEKFFVENFGMNFYGVRAGKLRRYFSLKNFIDPINIILGFIQACMLLKKIKPKVVVSIGGFASFPTVLAAALYKVPIICISCDMSLGLTTKISIPFSTFISCAYQETAELCRQSSRIIQIFSYQQKKRKKIFKSVRQDKLDQLHIVYDDIDSWILGLGNPIRKEIYHGNSVSINKKYQINNDKKVILFLGGSKGASQINELVLQLLASFDNNITIIHQTGFENECGDYDIAKNIMCQYISMGFITDDYADVLARADVVVARAGAGTLWEIVANEIPSVIIPLSRESSRGDQLENAEYFASKGMVINAGAYPNDDEIHGIIIKLCMDMDMRATMKNACRAFGSTTATENISKYIDLFL